MHKVIIFLSLFLVACSTKPVMKFPVAPEDYLREPREMKQIIIEPGRMVKLSEFSTTVLENYTIAKENEIRLKAWQNWYTTQKAIYNEEDSVKLN